MALLGLLLVAACAWIAADVVVENAGHLDTFLVAQQRFVNRPIAGIFIAGAGLGLLFAAGLGLVTSSVAALRSRRRTRRATPPATIAAPTHEPPPELEKEAS